MVAAEFRNTGLLGCLYVFLALALLLAVAGGLLDDDSCRLCGEFIAVVVVCSLVGFLLLQLARLRRKYSELESQFIQVQRVNSLDEISAGIAHEINNPLNIIMQEAEIIRVSLDIAGSSPVLDEVEESLQVIMGQVRRCSDITRKLLDMARNRLTVAQQVDVNKLLRDLLLLMEEESAGKKIQVIRQIPDEPFLVCTDPPLLRQVFLNLFKNAVQAVGSEGAIIIACRREWTKIIVTVEDNGPGIPDEYLPHIFTPFFTTKSHGEGTGMGLAVSLRIINQLGGSIDVKSSVGKGTVFSVVIPSDRTRSS
ncbi:sensor histidine kinase [Maridesulfovibrio sp. FT414]|uniref:sensor histidine kinase n=1 Tax=Maridesulfovibrio sp. FT414 TaxID=2979469 RepID=UPI003D80977B